ncbi:hypothetical protein PAMC26577_05655 [Caballeronia sordidicola]|uniref:Uncharacterized protein n=1 Tax=Caballeronia sordidicola TaxID=196367 RepID=A0A242N4L5_CABSO|nr:hypothetical protein PAMC26577_05655 [Caballeronia sordidicola]
MLVSLVGIHAGTWVFMYRSNRIYGAFLLAAIPELLDQA